jgi:succinate-semialdehyde dehydrogenase/glutarate-semialdehyde dehydrogenase
MTSSVTSHLKNPSLLPEVDSHYIEVFDPSKPDSVVGRVRMMDREDAKRVIEQSHKALPSWRDGTTAMERSRLLTEWSRLISDNADDIATIMTLESGKSLKESQSEVNYGKSFLDYYAGEAIRPTGAGGGFLVPSPFPDEDGRPRGQIMAINQAVGVTTMITPWNFPIAMITRKVGPALAAGCTAVVKPSQLTPLTAVAIKTLADQAGIPPHVFQLVIASSETTSDIGNELSTNPLVRKISFTGSTRIGKLLMKQASDTCKRVSMELGGNAPFVVFGDANLDQAVEGAIASKFRNAGQTCVCADRFLVHSSVHDEFVDKLHKKVAELKVGPGIEPSTKIGPLITPSAVEKVHGVVQDAIKEGAKCLIGGSPLKDLGPNFYAPTILTNVSPDSDVWKEENFGPVVPVIRFDSDEEALALVNDVPVGLSSYFCTTNPSRAFSFAKAIEAGIVGVNDGIISTATAPFGGVKESGMGREGSPLGLAEYLETKYVFMNF